jgi:transcriptional regulator of arginine metabolism
MTTISTKQRRQDELTRLVAEQQVHSQDEIVRLLKSRGISATQASVSRDVRELGLVRVDGRYLWADRLPEAESTSSLYIIDELVTSAEPVGANLIVIRTPPGAAGTVAYEVDSKRLPDIAGTIAGDDTIFVAVRSRAAQGRVLAAIRITPPQETSDEERTQ